MNIKTQSICFYYSLCIMHTKIFLSKYIVSSNNSGYPKIKTVGKSVTLSKTEGGREKLKYAYSTHIPIVQI